MPPSKQAPRLKPFSSKEATRPRDAPSVSVHQFGSRHAFLDTSPVRQEAKYPPRTVSAWRDILVTALWVVPAFGILAYFVGVVAAIAVAAALVVALALCLNSAIEHTIELDR